MKSFFFDFLGAAVSPSALASAIGTTFGFCFGAVAIVFLFQSAESAVRSSFRFFTRMLASDYPEKLSSGCVEKRDEVNAYSRFQGAAQTSPNLGAQTKVSTRPSPEFAG
ncbi:hypothetical protein [Noviherbaspirillum sp.]|uniref:hypothetical protein n=1 Tax=Noviherbaspirillum sp. TaxID=1926288 RepID=UPI0025CBC315|nr:hypothetical protein [Noviherbaspirillum sp.]